jgi:hypothetical protein
MDYRFAIRCWQDQAGDENAKANVFVNGTQVVTEVEITATSEESPQLITWESTGLDAPSDSTSVEILVKLANEYYVDADTDRNIRINGIGYRDKANDVDYKKPRLEQVFDDPEPTMQGYETITDWNNFDNYLNFDCPTAVTGDQIPAESWNPGIFQIITVWGGDDSGAIITMPITESSDKGAVGENNETY